MGAYYVEEKYSQDDRLRRRFWFEVLDDDTVLYTGGMSYVNKRRVMNYQRPPNSVQNHVNKEGYHIVYETVK